MFKSMLYTVLKLKRHHNHLQRIFKIENYVLTVCKITYKTYVSMKNQMFVIRLTYPLFRGAVTNPISPLYLPQHSASNIKEHHIKGRKQSNNVQHKILSWCRKNEKQKIPSCKALIFPGV